MRAISFEPEDRETLERVLALIIPVIGIPEYDALKLSIGILIDKCENAYLCCVMCKRDVTDDFCTSADGDTICYECKYERSQQ